MKKKQELHREQDPRVQRSVAVALASAAVLVVAALGAVGLRVQQVHLAYRLDALRVERARTEGLLRQLEIEVATLRAPSRIESRARQLGMAAPARGQLKLAREYVTGGTGAAAERSQLAAVAGLASASRAASISGHPASSLASISGHPPSDLTTGPPLQQ